MIAIFYLVLQILKLYSYVVIANVVISWLIAFNVLNTQNRFVYSMLELTYKLTEPILNKIRRFLPNLGSLDISPIILLSTFYLSSISLLYLFLSIFDISSIDGLSLLQFSSVSLYISSILFFNFS